MYLVHAGSIVFESTKNKVWITKAGMGSPNNSSSIFFLSSGLSTSMQGAGRAQNTHVQTRGYERPLLGILLFGICSKYTNPTFTNKQFSRMWSLKLWKKLYCLDDLGRDQWAKLGFWAVAWDFSKFLPPKFDHLQGWNFYQKKRTITAEYSAAKVLS